MVLMQSVPNTVDKPVVQNRFVWIVFDKSF